MNGPLIEALEFARAGDWEAAHNIVQDIDSREAAWIHAYLHRVEGDDGNAGYWYRRADVSFPDCTLETEWKIIFETLSTIP